MLYAQRDMGTVRDRQICMYMYTKTESDADVDIHGPR